MWILDTSVAVKWFFTDEPGHSKSKEVLGKLVENPDIFAVPSLFFHELTAVLIRKSKFEKLFVNEALAAIYELGIPSFDIDENLSGEAMALACRYHVSYYDALFVALAKIVKGRWLTTDDKARKKIPGDFTAHLSAFL